MLEELISFSPFDFSSERKVGVLEQQKTNFAAAFDASYSYTLGNRGIFPYYDSFPESFGVQIGYSPVPAGCEHVGRIRTEEKPDR